jgi:hypothetical protein
LWQIYVHRNPVEVLASLLKNAKTAPDPNAPEEASLTAADGGEFSLKLAWWLT